MIRLLLIDDHGLFRESLSRLLDSEPDFTVVAHFATPDEARPLLTGDSVDLLLLDYDLGEENGLNFILRARAAAFGGGSLSLPRA
jgi:DNA-binding NarL/FixJ family response regulator